jgi:hypothetical protein
MTDFAHVSIPTLRDVLEGRIAPMTNTLRACVELTTDALAVDLRDVFDVPDDVLDARAIALGHAIGSLDMSDNTATLEALRRYWLV